MANKAKRTRRLKETSSARAAAVSSCLLALSSIALSGCHSFAEADEKPYTSKGQKHYATIDSERHFIKFFNIYYVRNGGIRQTMDLYVPEKGKKHPVVVWVHGGSWSFGDKNQDCLACRDLPQDFAVASVNYRHTDEGPWPIQMHDVKAAIRYLRKNAKQYGLDPDKIGVWGSSAGGHLAAMLGTTGDVKQLEGNLGNNHTSSRVQAVVDWCGPTNFVSAAAQAPPTNKMRFRGAGSAVYNLLGGRDDEKSLAAASPITYVSPDDPPFLIMHGEEDDAIPPAQSEEFYQALKKVGVDATYHLLPKRGHWFDSPEYSQTVKDFFTRTLGTSK